MTNPVKREKDTRQLMYIVFCLYVVLALNFVFIYNNFWDVVFLREFMRILNMTIICMSSYRVYKIIGTL